MSVTNLNEIKEEHVLLAINKVKKDNILLQPSTGFELLFDYDKFPPREIVQIAYKIATGNEYGQLWNIEDAVFVLKNLGFIVIEKISVWKFGTNWGSGAPSFFNFIKRENIVLSVSNFEFQIGDLVAITEGFTVYAIAKVLHEMIPVTNRPDLKSSFQSFKIDYSPDILFANVEWYDLSPTEIFQYELQQGIRKINQAGVKYRIINLWENRVSHESRIIFYVKSEELPPQRDWNYPCLVLIPLNWRDGNFKTSFTLFHYRSISIRAEIGVVKILNLDSPTTILHGDFTFLNNRYYSLGQSILFYQRLKYEIPHTFNRVLDALNDCAFKNDLNSEVYSAPGFRNSLCLSSETEYIIATGEDIFRDEIIEPSLHFNFTIRIGEAVSPHLVEFNFNPSEDVFNPYYCIVGRNGTGKTQFLSSLANKLVDSKSEGDFQPHRPYFSKIITASFSYFDKFRFPEAKDISYEFIGVKGRGGVLSEKRMIDDIWKSYTVISLNKAKKTFWNQCVLDTLEMDYLRFSPDELLTIETKDEFKKKIDDVFSSGQKIIFYFLTRLIAVIEKNSLILFDEPETHLHPTLAGSLIKTFNKILYEFNSFAIIGTHSPIIVQETPTKFVKIFDRREDYPIIYTPPIETFGENLTTINSIIFEGDQETKLYREKLKQLSAKLTDDEIETLFDNKLSLNARLTLNTIRKNDIG